MKTPKRKPTMMSKPSYAVEVVLIAFICMIGVASVNHTQPFSNQEQINVVK